jgi:hypothetical protein
MSFEEFVRYREEFDYGYNNQLVDVFNKLLERPTEQAIEPTAKVMNGINDLSGQENLKGIVGSWYSMDSYWKWIAQMYGGEMIDKFGGMAIVDQGLLPIGMVSLFRGKRVGWND